MLLPTIEALADEVTDAKICKVNVDEQPELAAKFKVMTIPTLMVFILLTPTKTPMPNFSEKLPKSLPKSRLSEVKAEAVSVQAEWQLNLRLLKNALQEARMLLLQTAQHP